MEDAFKEDEGEEYAQMMEDEAAPVLMHESAPANSREQMVRSELHQAMEDSI
jgi:hypothetical protein